MTKDLFGRILGKTFGKIIKEQGYRQNFFTGLGVAQPDLSSSVHGRRSMSLTFFVLAMRRGRFNDKEIRQFVDLALLVFLDEMIKSLDEELKK